MLLTSICQRVTEEARRRIAAREHALITHSRQLRATPVTAVLVNFAAESMSRARCWQSARR